jgi:hypothetical protein
MEEIAACLNVRRVEVESLVTFYAFLSAEPKGKIVIRVCDDVVDRLFGAHQVLEAFADELGVAVGETTADGRFTLEKMHRHVRPGAGGDGQRCRGHEADARTRPAMGAALKAGSRRRTSFRTASPN